jgi:NAD(P)-dependent dehydrogenase (short-subunit alcohol dehydrogenase family)
MAEPAQVAVITGAARGIGAAIAEAVVGAGGAAVLSDVEDDRGRALAEQLGDRATYCHCDATSEDDVATLLAQAERAFGPRAGSASPGGWRTPSWPTSGAPPTCSSPACSSR